LPRRRPFWFWPAVALLALAGLFAAGIISSRTSWVAVCNNTGVPIPQLTVSACGQSRTFRDIGDKGSVILRLDPAGSASEVAVFLYGDKPLWRGDYIEPAGGYHAIVRLGRNGDIECSVSISWWQHVLESVGLGR
jgi:hypothetical protein